MELFVKYIRGLWKTFTLLLRGGKLPEEANIHYRLWTERTAALVTAVFSASDKVGISENKRNDLKVKVDGREISLQTTLKGVAYHAKEEYAYLLKHLTENSLTTIHATNLNDEYALSRFIESGLIYEDSILVMLRNLHNHLKQVPNKN